MVVLSVFCGGAGFYLFTYSPPVHKSDDPISPGRFGLRIRLILRQLPFRLLHCMGLGTWVHNRTAVRHVTQSVSLLRAVRA